MENYYQILDVDSDAASREIKIAYKKQLRKHPPEKDPDGFEKIRNAYDVLNNEKSRAEYDAMLNYQDEIEEYREKALKAADEKNYKKAIKYFKKILVIEPSLANIRNMLGLAYLNDQNLSAALNQFTRIVRENPDNASYLLNLGLTYKEKGHLDKAEKYLKKSYEIDNINPETVLELSHIYHERGEKDRAVKLIRDAIEADGVVDFQDFIFFFNIVELHIISGDIEKAESVLNEIEDIIPEDPDSRSYVGWKFAELAVTLFDLQAYDLAEKMSSWALKFDPDNQNLSDIKSASAEFKRFYSLYQKLEADDRVIEPLKGPFYFYLYPNDGSVSDKEWEQYQKEVFQAIDSYVENQPETVINSIRRIKRKYYELYKLNDEITDLFKKILNNAEDQKDFFDQIKNFQNDNYLLDEFKGLLSLWLSQEYSERERERYSRNIFDKLDYYIQRGRENKILDSIKRIKYKYKKVYQLNKDFFDDLNRKVKKIKKENSKTNNYSNDYSSKNSNSNSSNYNSKSSNKSSKNYSSNNQSYNISSSNSNSSNQDNSSDGGSGCGCLILIIIAVIFLL